MRKFAFLTAILLSTQLLLQAQPDYKVVIDVTTRDTMVHKAVIRWVNEITRAEPTAQVEVVFYAQGPHMLVKNKSVVAEAITGYKNRSNVSFKVCQVALKNQKIETSELLEGVQTVPDGIYEIITKQRAGWGYIKASL